MIEARSITKVFGGKTVVDSLSFQTQGGIFGILGPNGAGKTTTIRMLLGILRPDEGEILFQGRPLEPQFSEKLGYLPEERGLNKKVKVKDTLRFYGELRGLDDRTIKERIPFWLERFDLAGTEEKKVGDLSKGMAQKIQIITTLLHDPEVLIFDEPFSGLDPASQELFLQILGDLSQKGKTVFFSTHIMDHAEKICRQILLLDNGKTVAQGTVSDLKARHGRPSFQLDFEGDGSFLADHPAVVQARLFPQNAEVILRPDTDESAFLRGLLDRLKLTRFQKASSSLHQIFLDLTKDSDHA